MDSPTFIQSNSSNQRTLSEKAEEKHKKEIPFTQNTMRVKLNKIFL
jgi:hypothetical protein